MKAFMDKEFMLQSPVAQHLYYTYAADMPICDYHCQSPRRRSTRTAALRTSLRCGWAAASPMALWQATTTSGA